MPETRNVRMVHVCAGVHVEAVPGSCVLSDIREHLRVIVPGTTHTTRRRPSSAREAGHPRLTTGV
ncbi:MAG TPA: hypothetical protein VKF80_09730 [Candidatus Eisenbacteria bacterium]|nr:hypothetical protein [Candidatus Eisenbacteria bacterium]